MKNLIATSIILLSSIAQAGDFISTNGIGKDDAGVKTLSLGYNTSSLKAYPFLSLRVDSGILTGKELSELVQGFVSISPQIKVQTHGMFLAASQGIGYVSNNRTLYLDNHLQFFTQLSGGLSTEKLDIGLFYKHISSGHASYTNRGLDLIGIEFSYHLEAK